MFHGQPVATGRVPVYAFVREYDDADHTVDVIYHTFYPYNRGKDVCIGGLLSLLWFWKLGNNDGKKCARITKRIHGRQKSGTRPGTAWVFFFAC